MRRELLVNILVFEMKRLWRDAYTWCGLLALTVLVVIGAYLYWQTLPPRPSGSRLFGEAYVLGLTLAFHIGIARDRQHHFDRYLVANLTDAANLYFGKLAAALVFLCAYALVAFVLALAASLGDAGYATHYTLLLFFASLLMLPLVVLIEVGINTRLPVPLLVISFFMFLAIYARSHDVAGLLRNLGLGGALEVPPALVRSVLAIGLAAAWYPLFLQRLGRTSLALRDATPYFGAHGPIDTGSTAQLPGADAPREGSAG